MLDFDKAREVLKFVDTVCWECLGNTFTRCSVSCDLIAQRTGTWFCSFFFHFFFNVSSCKAAAVQTALCRKSQFLKTFIHWWNFPRKCSTRQLLTRTFSNESTTFFTQSMNNDVLMIKYKWEKASLHVRLFSLHHPFLYLTLHFVFCICQLTKQSCISGCALPPIVLISIMGPVNYVTTDRLNGRHPADLRNALMR